MQRYNRPFFDLFITCKKLFSSQLVNAQELIPPVPELLQQRRQFMVEFIRAGGVSSDMQQQYKAVQPPFALIVNDGLKDFFRRNIILHTGRGIVSIAPGAWCEVNEL